MRFIQSKIICLFLMMSPLHVSAQTHHSTRTVVGDTSISNFSQSRVNIHTQKFMFLGKGMIVERTDKNLPIWFHITADQITGQRKGKSGGSSWIEMKGELNFRVVQKLNGVTRTVEGSAQSAVYNQKKSLLTISGQVNATLRATSYQKSIVHIHGDQADITMNAPHSILLSGIAAHTEIYLTYFQSSINGKVSSGPITITAFRDAALEPGSSLLIEGPGTTAHLTDIATHLDAIVVTEKIQAGYAQTMKNLVFSGGVKLDAVQKDATGKQLQALHSRSETLTYSQAQGSLKMAGRVQALYEDPERLDGPAKIQVQQATLFLNGDHSIRLSGESQTDRIDFSPRLLSTVKKSAISNSKYNPGRMDITQFNALNYLPGKKLSVFGKNLTIQSSNPAAGTATLLMCSQLTVTFLLNGGIDSLNAQGPVIYHFKAPESPGRSQLAGSETIDGSTRSLHFQNGKNSPVVSLNGPTKMLISNSGDNQRMRYQDAAGDQVQWNLSSDEVSSTSPLRTATLQMLLPDTGKKNAPAVQTRKKSK